jgi:cyclopropane-fatty-acyl-phospholipid synthase
VQALLHWFFSRLKGLPFAVTYWNGEVRTYGEGPPTFRLVLRSAAAAWRLLWSPDVGFGEGYSEGLIDVDGDLDDLLRLAHDNETLLVKLPLQTWWRRVALRLPTAIKWQRRNIAHHYDLGNDFYRLWLDPTLTYSCAYFRTPSDSLHQAQLQKIDHVLSKLNLQPEDRLLDIGCGWGWLILRAAQQYGVRAVGLTLSEEQYSACQNRIKELGLADRVEVRLLNYRELDGSERFDKIASVGMFEHVGLAQIPGFMATVARLLNPGGLLLLHSITRRLEAPVGQWISRNIFPGGYIPSWREVVAGLADQDLRLLDAEDLRPHYAMTLDHWSANYENVLESVRSMYGDRFVRMWRLYLRSSAAAFRLGGLHIHQFLCSQGITGNHPLTRAYIYNDEGTPAWAGVQSQSIPSGQTSK